MMNRNRLAITAAVIGAITSSAMATDDSAFDEAIRQAQACSEAKAVKYSRDTIETAQTIAETAFDACESLWHAWYHDKGDGKFYTTEQLLADPSIAARAVSRMDALGKVYGFPARREAEIKRLRVLVLETRTAVTK